MLLVHLDSVDMNEPDRTFDVVLPSRYDSRYRLIAGHPGKINLDIVVGKDDNIRERCEQLQRALEALPDCHVDIMAQISAKTPLKLKGGEV